MNRQQSIVSGIFVLIFFLAFAEGAAFFVSRGSFFDGGIFFEKTDIQENRSDKWQTITRAIDGDTIELENGDRVRYIGVNAPESVDPRRKVECFGKEASAFNRDLVEGKRVRLEKDVSDRDKYNRFLRFVFLEDGTLVNEMLVREGYAFASAYPPDVSKAKLFRDAEREAREGKRGLWAEDTCQGRK